MKKSFFKGFLCCLALLISATLAYAEFPKSINVQGRLTNDSGQPITGSGYSVEMNITGGSSTITSSTSIKLDSDGLYSADLNMSNFINGYDSSKNYKFKIIIKKDGTAIITPTEEETFSAVPYCFRDS